MDTQRARIEGLSRTMGDLDPTDYEALEAQQAKVDAAGGELDLLETQWLELSERLEG